MNVLVGCEFSGVVRRAFQAQGHTAYSCDLLPADDGETKYHIQEDILKVLESRASEFDLGIFHPPCTRLANSGNKHLYIDYRKENGRNLIKWAEMEAGANFFKALLHAKIPKVAVENPIMHRHGKAIIGMKQTQIIQPYEFGHGETKATCLWLINLPKLVPTNLVKGRRPRVHFESPGADRWKRRSITYQGIAEAMAKQWGSDASGSC